MSRAGLAGELPVAGTLRESDRAGGRPGRLPLLGLTALYLVSRLIGLRAMPIFGDEAIYVHWARLIAEHPIGNAFVSLQDPKPPLHFWLMALVLPFFHDPLFAGRLLSVAAGAAALWLAAGLAEEVARRFDFSASVARSAGGCAALFAVFCPFAAFYQRMAVAESLFLCEAIAVGWLSLRAAAGQSARGGKSGNGVAISLGVVLGAAMLTRQGFSYSLWALAPSAYLCLPGPERVGMGSFLRRLALSSGVAILLWAPYLLWPSGPSLLVRVLHAPGFREPMSMARRIDNAKSLAGWLAAYLTPPVAVFLLVSLVWLCLARRRAFAFLLIWLSISLLPLILFGSVLFSRYVLPGVLPLWISGGLLLASIGARLRPAARPATRLAFGVAGCALLLLWPARNLLRAAADWKGMPMAPSDRTQYVSGWPAGAATESAVALLRAESRRTPIVLITPEISGNPTDAAWVLLGNDPRVRLYSVRNVAPGVALRPASDAQATYLLSGDLRDGSPEIPTRLPARWPVFFLAPDPFLTAGGWRKAADMVMASNPGASVVARFENPAGAPGDMPSAVAVFRLR